MIVSFNTWIEVVGVLLSMTGYGQSQVTREGVTLSTDIHCLNGRYFDLAMRLPRVMQSLEPLVRQKTQEVLSRGKISVTVVLAGENEGSADPRLNTDRLRQYQQLFQEIQDELGLSEGPTFAHYVSLNDIIAEDGVDRTDLLKALLTEGLDTALRDVKKMQRAEGANLGADLLTRITRVRCEAQGIEQQAQQHRSEDLERYRSRIQELVGDVRVDEDRLLQEIAMMAEKRDITEECTRLNSHLDLFGTYMDGNEAAGKRLGFLLQEMGREVNTIGSKSNQIEISHTVVRIKDELEKIREQVQNIL